MYKYIPYISVMYCVVYLVSVYWHDDPFLFMSGAAPDNGSTGTPENSSGNGG